MQTVTQSQLAITGALSSHRRRIAAISPKAFAQVYLAKHMRLKPSRMHEDLYGMLAGISSQRGQRIAVAAPRGHAKSTVVSLAYILWSILYKHEQLVLIISGTKEQAALLLKNLKDTQGIWASFDGQAFVIDDLLQAAGKKKGEVVLVSVDGGQEAFARIRDPKSTFMATVAIPFETMGTTAVDMVEKIVKEKTPKEKLVSGPYLYMDAVLVDKNNVPADGKWPF